jgi:uncharacterized protein (TIGR03435 family)
MRWTGWLAAIVLASTVAIHTQAEFEVASVKESPGLENGGTMRLMPGGGITARHLPARNYITIAFDLQPFQLAGVPDWTRNSYYDITAKPAGSSTREQTFAMLRALLTERFKLAFHRENRQVDGFALVRARSDRLGPNLQASAVDCEKQSATVPRCRQGGITTNTFKAVGSPMWSLMQVVIAQVGAPISDDTHLTGAFDMDLRWSNDVAPSDDLRSIFTALEEQLGLKLERRRVSAEIFVIDRIERPGPD